MAGGQGRIPDSLKAIFLTSNQGNEVYEPPKDCSANKVFRRKTADGGKITPILSKPQFARFQSPNAGQVSCNEERRAIWSTLVNRVMLIIYIGFLLLVRTDLSTSAISIEIKRKRILPSELFIKKIRLLQQAHRTSVS